MATGIIVRTDGTLQTREFDTYEEINEALSGYIEGIFGEGWTGYCNEDGKLIGLPVNRAATWFAQHNGWNVPDFLVGPVIFFGPTDEEGDDTSVPQWVIDRLHQGETL